jgi:hypothetical protein
MDGTYGNLIGRSADGTWHDGAKALLLAPDGVWFQNRGYAAVKTTTSLWDDQWHHVAATYDITDNSVKIYIDGVQEAVGTLDLTASPENLSWYYWLSNGSGGHFTGEMKDVRIYDRTLSETDIIALYLNRASGFTGTEFHFANHDAYGYTAEVLPEYATDQSFSWAINIRTKTGGPLISTAYEQIGDGARYLYIDDSNGKVVFAAQDSGATASVVSYTPVNDGQWHNISVTYDDVTDVVRLYVDGMPQGSEIIALKNLQGGNNRPGFGYMGGFGWYTGDMKDIRFYNRVLTENEAFLVYRPRPIRSDFDGDTYVDIEDFNFFVGQWLNDCDTVSMDDCKADFDNNGYVDFADFAVFAAEYLLY